MTEAELSSILPDVLTHEAHLQEKARRMNPVHLQGPVFSSSPECHRYRALANKSLNPPPGPPTSRTLEVTGPCFNGNCLTFEFLNRSAAPSTPSIPQLTPFLHHDRFRLHLLSPQSSHRDVGFGVHSLFHTLCSTLFVSRTVVPPLPSLAAFLGLTQSMMIKPTSADDPKKAQSVRLRLSPSSLQLPLPPFYTSAPLPRPAVTVFEDQTVSSN